MKVAIFETSHFEVAHTLISLFDKPGNEITIFIHPQAHRQLLFLLQHKAGNYTWIVKTQNETNRSFIRRVFDYTKNHSFDLLYFNTIADNFIIYAFHLIRLKKIPAILTLHDINSHFKYKFSGNPIRLVRYLGKRLLIKRFRMFNVLAGTMIPYLREKIAPAKKIYSIAGNHFDPAMFKPLELGAGKPIKIVIPGSVDERRRNYTVVTELLETIATRHLPIEICLLGGFAPGHSQSTRKFCLSYLRNNAKLKIFEEEIVDQPVFDQHIQESHFIWMPLQIGLSINDGIIEEYGKTICSGNIGDAIKYARPFFIPRLIPIDEALYDNAIRYDTIADILSFIEKLNSTTYSALQKKAWAASFYYTKDNIISRNSPLFT